jgi:hypothetical protein
MVVTVRMRRRVVRGAVRHRGLGTSYAQLVPMGRYEPPWRYPAEDLALDLSYHLAYGIGTGVAFELVAPAGG